MALLGRTLQNYITGHNSASSRLHTVLKSVHLKVDGTIEAKVAARGGEDAAESVRAKTLVLALGGYQDFAQSCLKEFYPGVSLRSFDPAKIILSDRLLAADGIRDALLALGSRAGRCRVVILGGSHSAFSAVWALTNLLPPNMFSPASIQLLYRNRLRIFYPSAEEALLDNYLEFHRPGYLSRNASSFPAGRLAGRCAPVMAPPVGPAENRAGKPGGAATHQCALPFRSPNSIGRGVPDHLRARLPASYDSVLRCWRAPCTVDGRPGATFGR